MGQKGKREEEREREKKVKTNRFSSFGAMSPSVLDVNGVADEKSVGSVATNQNEESQFEIEFDASKKREIRESNDSRVDQPVHREPNREPNCATAEQSCERSMPGSE